MAVYEPPIEIVEKEPDKVLAALSYFSALFLPFVFPLVVLFTAKDSFTKKHSKKALILQSIPVITGFFGIGILFILGLVGAGGNSDVLFLVSVLGVYLLYLIELVVILVLLAWNVICGIKLFRN